MDVEYTLMKNGKKNCRQFWLQYPPPPPPSIYWLGRLSSRRKEDGLNEGDGGNAFLVSHRVYFFKEYENLV